MHKSVIPKKNLIPEKLFESIQRNMPIVTVDLLIVRNESNLDTTEILLIKRNIYPEIGKWCLVGGRILKGESFRDAINRQVDREFGTTAKILKPWSYDTPIAINNNPHADVQKHYVSMLFPLLLTGTIHCSSGPEWSEAKWFPIKKLPSPLGFNQKKEIGSALVRLRQTLRTA